MNKINSKQLKRPLSVSDIGLMVKNKRKQENLCQKEVAGLCGVGVRLLSDLENGKETARKYNTGVFTVFGGKSKLRHQPNISDIRDVFGNEYLKKSWLP